MKSSWMLVAAALFALMGVLVKHLSAQFSSAELVFYRSVFGLAAIWIAIAVAQRRLFSPLATPHAQAHVWRGLSGFTALMLFFYAIARLPLATAVTLNYTAPLFLAGLSAWWLKERHGRGLVGAVLLGFVGIVLLLRPQVEGQAWMPALAGLVSGMLAAVAYVNVKSLGRLGEPEWRVVFYFSLISALGGLPWALASDPFHSISGTGVMLILGVGGFGALAQLALTRAYKHGKTLVAASLAYSTVVFSSLFGIWIWDEVLPPSSWLAIGLIVASGLLASAQSRAPAGQD